MLHHNSALTSCLNNKFFVRNPLFFLKNTLFQIIPDCFPPPPQSRTIWLRVDSKGESLPTS